MLMQDVLEHPTRVLSDAQRRRFFADGCLVLPGAVDAGWLARLHAATEEMVHASREASRSDDRFVLEDGHSRDTPRLRRLSSPVSHHEAFWAFASQSVSADVAADVCGHAGMSWCQSNRWPPRGHLKLSLE